jgi:hypothetical protein
MSDITVEKLMIYTPPRPKLRIYRPKPLGEVVTLNLGQITFMAAQPFNNSLPSTNTDCSEQSSQKPTN